MSAESFPTNLALEALLNKKDIDWKASHGTVYTKTSVINKLCDIHEERLSKFCVTCSELICEKCVTEIHDHEHEITTLPEAAEKYSSRLKEVDQALKAANEKLEKLSELLENAKMNCKTDADAIKTKIAEAETWAVQLVRNCMIDLCSKTDQKKVEMIKEIKKTELEESELVMFSKYLINLSESLQSDNPQGFNATSKNGIDNLKRKSEELSEHITLLERRHIPNEIGLCFQAASSKDLQFNVLGTLEFSSSKTESTPSTCNLWLQSQVTEIFRTDLYDEKFKGFARLKSSCNVFTSARGSSFTSGKGIIYLGSCLYGVSLSSMITPVTDISGFCVLCHSKNNVYKIKHDPSSERCPTSYDARKLDITEETVISAICWDETRADCYALLKDGFTIISINFSGLMKRKVQVKLDEPVASVTSRQLHVSEQGGMAICDKDRKLIRYYDKVQSKASKIVTAPPEIRGWYPVYVVTRKVDQRWFVAWETLSCEIEEDGVPYARIYQYSERFNLEGLRFKLSCHNVEAFSFGELSYNNRMNIVIAKKSYNSKQTIVSSYTIEEEAVDENEREDEN